MEFQQEVKLWSGPIKMSRLHVSIYEMTKQRVLKIFFAPPRVCVHAKNELKKQIIQHFLITWHCKLFSFKDKNRVNVQWCNKHKERVNRKSFASPPTVVQTGHLFNVICTWSR